MSPHRARQLIHRLRGIPLGLWSAEQQFNVRGILADLAHEYQRMVDIVLQRNSPEAADLDLLAKMASGEGGIRTGALKRAGYLEWTVTPAGHAALEQRSKKG